MNTRQAILKMTLLFPLLAGLFACSPPQPASPTPTPFLASTAAPTLTAAPPASTPAATPVSCLDHPGRVETGRFDAVKPQEFYVYLPPCYDEDLQTRYPALYLLHGQTYTADQWIRLGAVDTLDRLISAGEIEAFIVVFPDDRYWNIPFGSGFGQRLVEDIIPYIDATYRTIPERDRRAIGGLSRGAGWAFRLGFTRWDLFGVIGLHSPAILQGDGSNVEKWIAGIPQKSQPSVFLDIGNRDQELKMARLVEATLNENDFAYEWHLYNGAHTEEYWRVHVDEYIRWYAEQWK
ncbi:MAG: hypothetical protein HXY42_13115 [Chloroflexi bacterium]|nr:hypothetical protein [Chloroflexota bacterium]